MSEQVNIHEAKTHFSRLVERAEGGEEIVIARAGKPVATLAAFRGGGNRKGRGAWKGKVWMPDDFNAPDPEIEAMFYGDDPLFGDQDDR